MRQTDRLTDRHACMDIYSLSIKNILTMINIHQTVFLLLMKTTLELYSLPKKYYSHQFFFDKNFNLKITTRMSSNTLGKVLWWS